jgi:hypothetical protein
MTSFAVLEVMAPGAALYSRPCGADRDSGKVGREYPVFDS